MDVHEGVALPLRLHNVLLALSGRLDDTALGEARQLAARALFDEAAELIVGALAAGRIAVRSDERRELIEVLGHSGADTALADLLSVNDAEVDAGIEHRFSAADLPDEGVAGAIEPVTRLLPDIRQVHAVWRNTVAGSVPGPMPQRLLLVEVGPEGSAPATAYRMDVALRRAGIRAVVEVGAPGSPWSGYHHAAFAAAVPVKPAVSVPVSYTEPAPERAPVVFSEPESEPEPAPEPEPEPAPEPVASEPEPEPVPEPEAERQPEVETPAQPASAAYAPVDFASYAEPAQPAEPPPAAEPPPEPPPPEPEPVASEPAPPAAAQPAEPEPAEPEPEPAAAAAAPETPWEQHPQSDAWGEQEKEDLAPGELFWPRSDTEPETRAESTADLTASEVGQLRAALRKGHQDDATSAERRVQREAVEFPAGEGDQHALNDRDRELLRELHAELAKREREQAAQVRLNGWEHPGG